MPERHCCLCDEPIDEKRSDARFCSDVCRSDANRIARLLAGKGPLAYRSVRQYLDRSDSRTNGARRAVLSRLGR